MGVSVQGMPVRGSGGGWKASEIHSIDRHSPDSPGENVFLV